MIRLCERDEEAQRSTTVDGGDGEMKRDHERDDEINMRNWHHALPDARFMPSHPKRARAREKETPRR